MNNVVLIIIAIATTFVIDKVFDDVLSPAAKFMGNSEWVSCKNCNRKI